jgi:hypothetical protein
VRGVRVGVGGGCGWVCGRVYGLNHHMLAYIICLAIKQELIIMMSLM